MIAAAASAHDPGLSTAEIQVKPDAIVITTGFAPDDARLFLPEPTRGSDRWTEETFEDVRDTLETIAPLLWDVRADDVLLRSTDANVELLPGDNVSFRLTFEHSGAERKLRLSAPKLGELPAMHRQFVSVQDDRGSTLARKLLRASDATIEVALASGMPPEASQPGAIARDHEPSVKRTFDGFLWLGVEHIWTGYDHLLFLFALLTVCRSFRSVVAIVSCFTVGHSVTLALATLDVFSISPRVVEPAIAASIVFVAAENLLRRGAEPRGRWALTLFFGLIHGFGFAGVLRELGVGQPGSGGLALPLFSFNLGVELGQIAIAAIVLPLIWWLRKGDLFDRRIAPALSVAIGLAGVYWLAERTLFS